MEHRPAKPIEEHRKRLRFRSWHRGTKEIDLLLGNFADAWLDRLTIEQLRRYEALLEASDADLFEWVVGGAAAPQAHDHDVLRLLRTVQLRTVRN